jgi:hypothetical protein
MLSYITMMILCGVVSSLALYLAVRSVYQAVDNRSFFVSAFLMTLVNLIGVLHFPSALEWAAVAVLDFIILLKILDCSVYFSAVSVGLWIGVQILFYDYLSGPIQAFLFSGS